MNCDVIKNRIKEGAKVIDVREPNEFFHGRLPNAINVPMSSFHQIASVVDKDDEVLLYCRSGSRSEMAKRHLQALGYNAINIGGIIHYPGCV